jgi:hypothetical protein
LLVKKAPHKEIQGNECKRSEKNRDRPGRDDPVMEDDVGQRNEDWIDGEIGHAAGGQVIPLPVGNGPGLMDVQSPVLVNNIDVLAGEQSNEDPENQYEYQQARYGSTLIEGGHARRDVAR